MMKTIFFNLGFGGQLVEIMELELFQSSGQHIRPMYWKVLYAFPFNNYRKEPLLVVFNIY